MPNAVRKTISLASDLAEEVEALAHSEAKTISAVIQEALRRSRVARRTQELRGIQGYWSGPARSRAAWNFARGAPASLVVAEGHAWFLRRYDRGRALQFLAMIDAMSPLEIASVGKVEQAAASQLLRRFHDRDLTLTDAVGLHLMRARKLHTCWSTDFHLGLTGVPLVIQPH